MDRAQRISRRRVRETDLPETRTPIEGSREITLDMIKNFCRTMDRLVNLVCLVPKTMVDAGKRRQRQTILNQREAERIDRICNPSKYRGK